MNVRKNKNAGIPVPAIVWWVTVAFLLAAVVYPMTVLIANSFRAQGTASFDNYRRLFSDPSIRQSLLNSLRVVVPSTVLSTALGVFCAWAVVRTDVPGRKLFSRILAIPYFIPPFIGAISWTFLLGPKGILNRVLMDVFRLSEAPIDIYTIGGMIFVMSVYRFAVPFIVVMPTMKRISASMEEAARISGAAPLRAMLDITLPLLLPSILGSMLLVFLFILSDFGVSAVLGAPNRIRLVTTEIFYLINRPDLPDHLQIASAYAMLLTVFALGGLYVYRRILKGSRYAVVRGESGGLAPASLPGAAKWGLFAALCLIFLVTTMAPVAAACVTALTKTWGIPFSAENATLANFTGLAAIRNISRAFRNSLLLAFLSALIITAVTLIVSYMAVRKKARGVAGVRIMEIMVTLPYALPGTIIALGMILAFARPLPYIGISIYGTFSILLIAYVARFLNLGYNNITGAISQIDTSLEEAARMAGAGEVRTFRDIVIPLLLPSLGGTMLLVIAPTISEISLSSLLWSVRNETIGTVIYSAMEEGRILREAALAVLLILLVVIVNFAAHSITERKDRYGKTGDR